MDLGTHNQWIKELSKYLPNQSNKDIIKYSLAYTLQSFRNEENMGRFKWKNE